jgi:hypothetical protein
LYTIQGHLARLICGDFDKHSEMSDILKYISHSISQMECNILAGINTIGELALSDRDAVRRLYDIG